MKRKQIETKIFYFENDFIIKLYSYKNFAKMQGENFENELVININEMKNILWKNEKDTFAVAFQIAMIIEERINDLGFSINGNSALYMLNNIANIIEDNNITFNS